MPVNYLNKDAAGNVYDFAFGMNWSGVINDSRVKRWGGRNIENVQEMEQALAKGKWQTDTINPKIILHKGAFYGTLFGSNQSICVLEVAPGARMDIVPAAEGTLETTSDLTKKTGAVAAVNGSFFNMKPPYGSITYLKVDGELISPNKRGNDLITQGCVATNGCYLGIAAAPDLGKKSPDEASGEEGREPWENAVEGEDVLTSGPVLILNGACIDFGEESLNTTRHPRTAVGRRPDGTSIFVTADGRHREAAGLSMRETQLLMAALGCSQALNLDGGGSTTMIVNGEVVNHPCDNKLFDAAGQRKVANAICISNP